MNMFYNFTIEIEIENSKATNKSSYKVPFYGTYDDADLIGQIITKTGGNYKLTAKNCLLKTQLPAYYINLHKLFNKLIDIDLLIICNDILKKDINKWINQCSCQIQGNYLLSTDLQNLVQCTRHIVLYSVKRSKSIGLNLPEICESSLNTIIRNMIDEK